MGRLKRWIRINVLKKEELKFTVYFNYNLGNVEKTVPLEVTAKSKAEAKNKAKSYVRDNALPGKSYRFIKVVESGSLPLRYKDSYSN